MYILSIALYWCAWLHVLAAGLGGAAVEQCGQEADGGLPGRPRGGAEVLAEAAERHVSPGHAHHGPRGRGHLPASTQCQVPVLFVCLFNLLVHIIHWDSQHVHATRA